MNVVQTALRGVADEKRLKDQGDLSIPLLEIAVAYNALAKSKPNYFELTARSTGRELKIALAHLKLADKLTMLELYKSKTEPSSEVSAPVPLAAAEQTVRLEELEAVERIKFRALAKRVVLFTCAPIPPLLAGAVVAVAWSKGHLLDSSLVNGFMSTVLEMFKLLFAA